MHCAIFCY